jgi:uncharacterized protein (TIGR03067 family)
MSDLDKLQGLWDIRSVEVDGAFTPPASLHGSQLVIEADTFRSLSMGAPYAGTLTLDHLATPKSIDMHFTEGTPKGMRNLGIYKIARDRWTMCIAMYGTIRPSRFATKPGTNYVLQTLQRARVRATARPRTGAPIEAASLPPPAIATTSSAPATVLEGEWAMIEGVFNGVPMEQSMVTWCQRVTRGDVTTVLAGPQTMLKARFQIEASTAPAAIDYENLAGSNKGKAQAGIWALDGGTLRVCMAAPGKPRPKDFASSKGDGRSLTTWRLSKR